MTSQCRIALFVVATFVDGDLLARGISHASRSERNHGIVLITHPRDMSDDVTVSWIGLSALFFVYLRWDFIRGLRLAYLCALLPSLHTYILLLVLWITNVAGVFLRIGLRELRAAIDSRGREIFALPRARVIRRLYCDATGSAGRGRGCIQMRVHAGRRAAPAGPKHWLPGVPLIAAALSRYANSPLFPDRVLKAWARALRGGRVGLWRAVSAPHIREH